MDETCTENVSDYYKRTKTMNTIGNIFRFTGFGESHGNAVGGVIDGCHSGLHIDFNAIRHDLDRRAGRDETLTRFISGTGIISPRAKSEPDEVEFLSGILDGVTLGTPIAFIIRNSDTRSEDYEEFKDIFRPGHADSTYQAKYGIRDWRGGGRASARETAARVVAGSIAKQLLQQHGITVCAQVVQVGCETDEEKIKALLQRVQSTGDSIGGIVECRIKGLPAGIGEPVFDKLQARLAYAVMSINACKGFDYGSGFEGVGLLGSEMYYDNPSSVTLSGGALGGISDGTDFCFRCVFKPTPSISREIHGRHDICIALRTPPIVEAMSAITLIDLILEAQARHESIVSI